MRYSNTHKQETRSKLLANARAIAKKGGFATTGIDSLMAGIGLSGGAFYTHFASKEALLEALVEEEMAHSLKMLAGEQGAAPDQGLKRLRSYLSSSHALHPEDGCMLPTLGAELARSGPGVRQVVERGLRQTQKNWSQRVGDGDAAWALMAQCVGALVLARAVESERTRKEILGANRKQLEKTIASLQPRHDPQAP